MHSFRLRDTHLLVHEIIPVFKFLAIYNFGKLSAVFLLQVTVIVTDINDHAPVFQYPTENNNVITIREPVVAGATVKRLVATDDDVDLNGDVVYSLLSGNADGLFSLHHSTGLLTATCDFDGNYNGKDVFLRLLAEDRGSPERLRTQSHLIIHFEITESPLSSLSRTLASVFGQSAGDTITATATLTFAICVGVAILATCLSVVVLCSLLRCRKSRSKCSMWTLLCNRTGRAGTSKSESRVTLPNSVSYVKSDIIDDYY